MLFCRYFFSVVLALIGTNFVECAEFVPVYMWGTNKLSEHVPALHKISEDSYKDTILESLENSPYLVVFAERTLSPEDFAQRDAAGNVAYPNLHELKEKTPVTYKPYVQNPIGAIKHLEKEVTEVSIGSFLNNPNVPKNNILIIDLNDAKDNEQRFHMLQRHDSLILSIYKKILEKHENVLAIYTAHHTSWVASNELPHAKARSLLQAQDEPDNSKILTDPFGMVYFSDTPYTMEKNTTNKITYTIISVEKDDNKKTRDLKISSNDAANALTFKFRLTETNYWQLEAATLGDKNIESTYSIVFPDRFSYHCTNSIFKFNGTEKILVLPGFQIEPFFEAGNTTFGDAYDCVGFTTIPIWSGLFVTFILLIILTFGITMMMDIKTMDRFDDAKGKTITINAAE